MKWIHILHEQPCMGQPIITFAYSDAFLNPPFIRAINWNFSAAAWNKELENCISLKNDLPDFWWINISDFPMPDRESENYIDFKNLNDTIKSR